MINLYVLSISGKTESTKIMVEHIVTLCKAQHEGLHDKIVQVCNFAVCNVIPG